MKAGGDPFDRIVSALEPLLQGKGFQRVAGLGAELGPRPQARHVAFEAGLQAVRVVWESEGEYVVLEAVEPDFADSWIDLLVTYIDLPRATEAELVELVETFKEELDTYFGQIEA
jgi:hypothetical protein